MARNGFISRRRRSENLDAFDLSPPDHSQEAHVLAVDDSLVDRKVIERLLRISCCKGLCCWVKLRLWKIPCVSLFLVILTRICSECAVTAVDSGRRALQFLGLDDEKSSSVDFDVSGSNIKTNRFTLLVWNSVDLFVLRWFSGLCKFRLWRWIWSSPITVCLEWLVMSCSRKSRSQICSVIHFRHRNFLISCRDFEFEPNLDLFMLSRNRPLSKRYQWWLCRLRT